MDGEPRVPGTLTIFTDAGLWKACLSDRAQQRIAFSTAPCPVELLAGLEEGIVQGTLDWRAQYKGKPGKR
jgi:hypothetical protein